MNEATNDEAHRSGAELRRQHAELIAKDAVIAELVTALQALRGAINFKAACITSNSAVEKVAFADDFIWKAVDYATAVLNKHGA